ncbi:MAG: PTS system mannose-specific IIA component [Alphaproteobacteria bacterium]|jgi:PTS system mannose-specific IIA component
MPVTSTEIGLVLVTHGSLATAFLDVLTHIVGAQTHVAAICIGPDDDVEARRTEILDALDQVDVGSGAVVMTDMFGGTPSNLALSALNRPRVEVVAGLNLPMLIKFASVRTTHNLADAVQAVQESGRKYINVASSFLLGGNGK